MLKLLTLTGFFVTGLTLAAEDILLAENNVKNGAPIEQYTELAAHPLYPYLQYYALRNNLDFTSTDTVVRFLKKYPNAPFSNWLAKAVFPQWIASGNNQAIINAYSSGLADETVQCSWRLALLNTGNQARAKKDIAPLWLNARDMDTTCSLLFSRMIANGSLSQSLIAERFQMAMQTNDRKITQFLQPLLSADNALAAHTWMAVRDKLIDPSALFSISSPQWRAAALGDVIYRIASEDVYLALSLAQRAASDRIILTTENTLLMRGLNRVAAKLAQDNNVQSEEIFRLIPSGAHNKETILDVLAWEIRGHRWKTIANLLSNTLDEDTFNTPEYLYWAAKAHEKLGNTNQAQALYHRAAQSRDFFGFLAAEKLGKSYQFNDHPISRHNIVYDHVVSQPEAYRIRTFLALGQFTRANQEFSSLISNLNDDEKAQAALFADSLGWSIQAVMILSRIQLWDALALRFPIKYKTQVYNLAARYGLSPATIFAIIRKESIFQPQIRSKAGAIGLMQLLPTTARYISTQAGVVYLNKHDLQDSNTNLALGTAYLAEQINNYGHLAYAAAAYNAGPKRVSTWQETYPELPLDEWIAQIPFYETRDYVKQVLAYEKVYEYRLGLAPTSYRTHSAIQLW